MDIVVAATNVLANYEQPVSGASIALDGLKDTHERMSGSVVNSIRHLRNDCESLSKFTWIGNYFVDNVMIAVLKINFSILLEITNDVVSVEGIKVFKSISIHSIIALEIVDEVDQIGDCPSAISSIGVMLGVDFGFLNIDLGALGLAPHGVLLWCSHVGLSPSRLCIMSVT